MPKRERYHGKGTDGRLTRPRAIIQLLELAIAELNEALKENDIARRHERVRLAQRMVVDAKAAVMKLEVRA